MPVWICPYCFEKEAVTDESVGQLGHCPSCSIQSVIEDSAVSQMERCLNDESTEEEIPRSLKRSDLYPAREPKTRPKERSQAVCYLPASGRRIRMVCPKCNRLFVVRTSPARCSYCHYIPTHAELMGAFGPLLVISVIILVGCLIAMLAGVK